MNHLSCLDDGSMP